jgi:hypothetical protein
VSEDIPVVAFDARDRVSVRDTLLILLDRALIDAMRRVVTGVALGVSATGSDSHRLAVRSGARAPISREE